MQLHDNWRDILKRAWSVRLIILSGLLTGVEMVLPMFTDLIPRWPFAVLSVLVTIAALVARVVAQPQTMGAK